MVRIRIGDDERELDWDEWERRVRDGRIPPDALVNLDAVTGDAFVAARTLESYRSLRSDATLAWQSRFEASQPPVITALLVGINIRIWWLARADYPYAWFDANLSNWTAPALEDGESWRTITMGLLHLGTPHIAMNMLWLAYTGWNLERALGRANLVLLYLGSVLGGSVLSMFLSPESRSLGASGGVFGLVAAAVVFGFLRPELLPSRGRRVFGLALLPYLVVMFISGLLNEGIDNWSHFGGLLTGGTLALIFDPEGLERRPGWNRGWRLGLAGTGAAVLLGLGLLGPRVAPLAPHERVEASSRPEPVVPVIDVPVRPAALTWDAPAGWRPGVTSTGEVGFASPSPRGDRAWAVQEEVNDRPVPIALRATEWSDEVRETFEGAVVDPPVAATLAGRDGLSVQAHLPGDVEVTWWGIDRGRFSLEAVWEVDAHRAARLAPLRDRLLATVRWADPPSLVDALAVAERTPGSARARGELAKALSEAGRPTEALALYDALVAEEPEEQDWIVGRLHVLAWYPAVVAHPDPMWEHALAAHPTSEVVLGVVEGLDAYGRPAQADAVLELAWTKSPGDRTLRRARRGRGLPSEIDDATNLPRQALFDASGRRRTEAEIEAVRSQPLDLATVSRLAAERTAARTRHESIVRLMLRDDPPAAVESLLWLQLGAPPEDPEAAAAALAVDLKTLEQGGTVAWVPESLVPELAVPGVADRIVPPTGG